jgi:hypothetical protein
LRAEGCTLQFCGCTLVIFRDDVFVAHRGFDVSVTESIAQLSRSLSRLSYGSEAFGGRTSYSGWAGFSCGFSSATETAMIRIFSLSGSLSVLALAGKSMP